MMPATWAVIRHHTFQAEGNLSLVCLPLVSCPDRYQWVSILETLASGQSWPKVVSTQQGGTKCWVGGFPTRPHPSQASPDGPVCRFYPSSVPIDRRCLTLQVWGQGGRRQHKLSARGKNSKERKLLLNSQTGASPRGLTPLSPGPHPEDFHKLLARSKCKHKSEAKLCFSYLPSVC